MITVIVPAYNEEKLIGVCLESLAAQTPLPDEVLIVNNASTDRTPQIVEQFIASHPNVNARMIYEAKKGCHEARETGWREAKGDVIVHVDADETFPSGWVTEIQKVLQKHPEAGAFGGTVRFKNAPFVVWVTQVLYNLLYPRMVQWSKGFPYLCGGMTVCKREVLEALDGYRNKPDDQLDDYYLSSQAHAHHFKLRYEPQVYAYHSLRRYEAGGLKAWLQWGVAAMDTTLYEEDVR
jgi:glycosyltransferase involved in cell wall biosynthesis